MNTKATVVMENALNELESFDEKLCTVERQCGEAASEASSAEEEVSEMRSTLSELIDAVREAMEGTNGFSEVQRYATPIETAVADKAARIMAEGRQ